MGFRDSRLAAPLCRILDLFISDRNLGLVSTANGTVRLWAGRVRIPDVAYFSWDRLPDRRPPAEAIPNLAPDLAAEILSDGNTPREMRQKRQDYFKAGVRLVWEINPRTRTVTVFKSAE